MRINIFTPNYMNKLGVAYEEFRERFKTQLRTYNYQLEEGLSYESLNLLAHETKKLA